jgi:hypothetical protein
MRDLGFLYLGEGTPQGGGGSDTRSTDPVGATRWMKADMNSQERCNEDRWEPFGAVIAIPFVLALSTLFLLFPLECIKVPLRGFNRIFIGFPHRGMHF